MTEYAKLVLAEASCHTIEIRERATGKEGIANTCAEGDKLPKSLPGDQMQRNSQKN